MKMIYFILTSSVLILLMLLIRSVLRKKLSPGVIYALWLIPFLRLLVPAGFVEIPLFGTAANLWNSPFSVTESSEDFYEANIFEKIDIYSEYVTSEKADSKPSGMKIYDAVFETEQDIIGENVLSEEIIHDKKDNLELEPEGILQIIWILGSAALGIYVIFQNQKLQKEADTLEVVGNVENIDICLSHTLKTPCLLGIRNTKILITENVRENETLYGYAIRHELAHYRQRDNLWNAMRICACVVYWWNPLVWYASKCAAEDAELACDAKVLKDCSVDERKQYGFALLELLEYAQNEKQTLKFATSVSGNQNSMKRRIQEISNRTNTRKYILFPVLLLLVLFLTAGCVYPSNESYLKTTQWKNGETEEVVYNEAKYEYSLQDEFRSMLFYYEVYQYGELAERKILSYEELEKLSDVLLLRHETYKLEDTRFFVVDRNGIETSIPILMVDNASAYATSYLHSGNNELLEIKPGEDLILMAAYQNMDSDSLPFLSCDVLSKYNEEELKKVFGDYNIATFARMILSDLPVEKLYEEMRKKEFPVEDSNQGHILADSWAKAFVEKDVETIVGLASEEVQEQLHEYGLLDEEVPMFGWSSPWPGLFTEEGYRIVSYDNSGAEILYYACLSTPHVVVWKETLEFQNGQVAWWDLQTYENISTLNDYLDAYPGTQISNTPMDYDTNGLGETLNKNALLSSSEEYRSLFDAKTAAIQLLNISRSFELSYYQTEEKGEETVVSIPFLQRDGSIERIDVTMWQPYGKEGIWIPKTDSNENEKTELKFYKGFDENKVCLAVMPDEMVGAGGDYRYIIPEEQVKWTDQYKQARSLATEGAWKDGERSAGIWIVFQDEWTCITEQGMIFDFDKRVDKEVIEEFYNLCMEEAWKYGTGTPLRSEDFTQLKSATLDYQGVYTVEDEQILTDLEKNFVFSSEIRGGTACPFTASLTFEFIDGRRETISLATDSCNIWLSDGVYYEYGYESIEELEAIFKENAVEDESTDWSLRQIEAMFLEKAESDWNLIDVVCVNDFAYDRVGVVLYTEENSDFINVGFLDKEGVMQHCGVEASLDENPEFVYHGNGEVTFRVCSKEGDKYKQKIIFAMDDDGVKFVSESIE